MKVIVRPIGTGKTKELFQAAATQSATILTENKRALQVKAESYGYPMLNIIDYKDLEDGNYYLGETIFIHKAENFLKWKFYKDYGLECGGFMATGERV